MPNSRKNPNKLGKLVPLKKKLKLKKHGKTVPSKKRKKSFSQLCLHYNNHHSDAEAPADLISLEERDIDIVQK